MKNAADLRGFYPLRPKAEVDNTLLDLQNSSYPTQPHSIIAKYQLCFCNKSPLQLSVASSSNTFPHREEGHCGMTHILVAKEPNVAAAQRKITPGIKTPA